MPDKPAIVEAAAQVANEAAVATETASHEALAVGAAAIVAEEAAASAVAEAAIVTAEADRAIANAEIEAGERIAAFEREIATCREENASLRTELTNLNSSLQSIQASLTALAYLTEVETPEAEMLEVENPETSISGSDGSKERTEQNTGDPPLPEEKPPAENHAATPPKDKRRVAHRWL